MLRTLVTQALVSLQEGDRQLWGDDEDDDVGLDDSIVRDFHFGGGFVQKRRSAADDGAGEQPAEAPKSKKEVGSFCPM